MSNSFSSPYIRAPLRCEVCDSLITYSDSLLLKNTNYTVCRSFDCNRVMDKKSIMTPLMFKSHLDFNRGLINKNRQKNIATKKHIEHVTAKEKIENQLHLKHTLISNPHLSADDIYILTIPCGSSHTIICEEERLNNYTNHLKSIINDAQEYTDASEVTYDEHHDAYGKRCVVDNKFAEKPQLKDISDRLCTMCKGGCCASGKEHAYLSVFSIRRYMDNNPDLSADDILNLYISYISPESINNSCINQRVSGCALPRELRSDICNGYYCDPLKKYHKKMMPMNTAKTVLAIQRSYTYWDRFNLDVSNEVINVALVDDKEVNITNSFPTQDK